MDLANLAETTAITEACEKLRGSDLALDEVVAICSRYRQELEQVQNELNRQVAGQVHDSSFASSMLSKAVVEMDGVQESLTRINSCCEQVREQTPGFDNLRRATIAKRNLHSVIEQLDLYGRVPNRVRRLMSELEREPRGDNLRRIFREWLGLSAWRDRVVGHVEDEATIAAQAEERAWRRARGEILANDTPQRAEEDSKTPSSASYETMLALLKDHFRDSYVLGDRIFELVMDSVERVFDLARERPQDLVCVAEICERRDRQVIREMRRRGLITAEAVPDEFDSKRAQFLTKLGEFADERAATALKQSLEVIMTTSSSSSKQPKPSQHKMRFDDLIQSADALLIDLQIVARDVRPCFPRSYDPLGVFRKWYEARLTREFSERVHDSYTEEELPSKEMLMMANWIARYVSAIHSFYQEGEAHPASLSATTNSGVFPRDVIGLERLCDNLLERYLQERVMPRIAVAARRRDELKYEIVKVDPEDENVAIKYSRSFLKTQHPEDFFSILSQELNNCADHFSGERSLKVFQTLLQFATTWFLPKQEAKLMDIIKDTDAAIAKRKKAKSSKPKQEGENEEDDEDDGGFGSTLLIERICTWLSDATRSEDLVRLLFDSTVDGLMRCEDVAGVIGKASDIVEDACSQFSDSALKFSKMLVETRIFADLDDKVFPEMFTKEWEESRYLGARIMTATLDDWFNHPTQGLSGWISSDFVLGRTWLQSLEALIKRYVDSLLKWKNKFGSAKRAAGRVEEDAKAFALFFKRHLGVLKMANSASCRTEEDVDRKFRIFNQLADVLQGDEYNLDPLVESLGNVEHTKIVIRRLRALRGGRVFNRREADLDKELVAGPSGGDANPTVFDIEGIAKLGNEVGEFEGELAAASFVEPISTERQIAFVKKISAFAKTTSFSQSKKKPTPTPNKGEEMLSRAAASNGMSTMDDGGGEPGDNGATRVLSMDEFVSASTWKSG